MSFLLIIIPTILITVALSAIVDWALCDFYFLRKWWNERPK